MPSTAAATIVLQRLRQEMAAAWGTSAGAQQPWLTEAALQPALACLERGSEEGWHDEASVLRSADIQAAALSLLRWVLLREAAAPRGLLQPPAVQRLVQANLLPLQACVLRLLQMQASTGAGGGGGSGAGSSATVAALQRQQQLDSFLAVQRLHEALDCVLDLAAEQAKATGS